MQEQGTDSIKQPRRGCLSIILRGLKWLGIFIIVLIVSGVIYQTVATASDKGTYLPPGQMVDVDGHAMHLYCMGEGSPTVILEAGGISHSGEWYWVQQQIAQTNQVCAYDRAGMGWSKSSPSPRDGVQIARELHTLLEQAEISAPYVLAGHSYGGVLNRIYAHQYPDEVLGIVLVDTGILRPEVFASDDEFQQWKRENDILQVFLWGMYRTGAYRLLVANDMRSYGYPDAVATELIALRSANSAFDTYYAESVLARRDLHDQGKAAEQLGDTPLIVLWATELPPLSPADRELLAEIQLSLENYSSNAITRFVEGANHGSIIGNEAHALQVSQAIRDVIAAAQSGDSLEQ